MRNPEGKRSPKRSMYALFLRNTPTWTMLALRHVANAGPKGLPHPYCTRRKPESWRVHAAHLNEALERCGRMKLVESGLYGPRGGLRWRFTTLGRAVYEVTELYPPGPELDAMLRLLAVPGLWISRTHHPRA